MPTQSHFSNWPVWVRGIVAASSLCVFVAVLSLIGGCGGMSSQQNPGEPDFYIAHVQDQNPVWFKSGANNPAPLTIPSLPAGSSVNDLAALRFTGPSDWLYLVAANANSLVILNKVGSSFQLVATVPVGVNPFGLAIDGTASFAYVSNTGGNSVTVVDLTSNQAVFTIALPNGSQPRGIAVTPDGKKVYVADQGTGTFSVIDAVARTVTGSITVGSQPNRMAMSPNGQELYVSNSGSGTVSVIDVLSDSVSTTIAGVANTRAVAVNGAGADLFVGQAPALSGPGSVALYDTATVSTSTTPIATAANPVFLLGIGPGSFLSADQNAARVTEQWTTTGNPPVNKVWTVGAAPAALAIVREINRSPSTQPQCKLTVTTVGTGTVAVNPSSASGNYTCGATVTLTATPGTGQQFTQWTGDLTGSANPATLKMDTSKNVTATFVAAQNVVTTVQANVPFVVGLYITVDGTSWAGHAQYSAPAGSTHTHTTTSPQIVGGSQYTFQNWTPSPPPNLPTSLTQTVTLGNANTAYIANFSKTGYVVSTYGCPVTITSTQPTLSSAPLVYPLNAPLTINTSLPAVEVLQNGAWSTYTSFPVILTLSGPITIWAACAIQKSATCVAQPPGLAGWWGFDPAGSASVADLSGNNNNGALINGVSQATGKVQSYLSSGATYFQAPSSNSLNFGTGPFSADMWVRWPDPSVNTVDNFLLDKFTGSSSGFQLALTRSVESPGLAKLMLRIYSAVTAEWDTIPPALPSDGLWHLVAFSYDPSQPLDNRTLFYVDGALIPTQPFNTINTAGASQSIVLNVSGPAPLTVGRDPVLPLDFAFTGGIDEVEMFNRVITGADLQPLMAADSLGKCKPSQTVSITVNTSPAGLAASINGISGTAPVSQGVSSGVATPVAVTTPQVASGSGYTFSNWTGAVAYAANASTTVTPAANTTVTANFALSCQVLTVNVSPAGSGTVAASPASGGLAGLPANCYAPGTVVTLTATGMAAQNYIFGSWSGAGTGFTTRTVVMNGPSAVTANFSLYPAPNLNFGGANWGYASGSTYQMIGKVGNNGADYNNIKITQVIWTAAAGTGAITDTTALPIAIGNLAGGTGALSSTLTLNAIMPTTVTQFKVCVSGTAVSPLSGNSVAWTDNQNCGHAFPRN